MTAGFVIFLLCIFLITNLVVGFLKGRDVKTVSDYAVGNNVWGSGALSMTLIATTIGGSVVYGASKRLVSIGIVALAGILFYSISCILRSFLITNQISRFDSCFSLGDFVGRLYGRTAKSFCGFIVGIFSIFSFCLQIQVLGFIFSQIFSLNLYVSIIFSTIVISFYTSFGGMRSVVSTDILQFVLTYVSLFLLLYFTLVRHFEEVLNKIPQLLGSNLFSTSELSSGYFASRASILLFLVNIVDFSEFQRLLMAKNRVVAKKMYINTAIGNVAVGVALMCIVFSAVVILGKNLDITNPMNSIIINLVPVKFVPFIGLGFLAIIFSTGDSYLHSAGLSLSKDFLEPMLGRNIKLIEVRVVTLLVGLLSTMIVLRFNNLLDKTTFLFLMNPMLAVPVLYGFLGFKSSNRMFWYAAISGFIVSLTINYIPKYQAFCVICGCFASLFAYFAVHIYENKGFKFVGNPIFPDDVKKRFRDKFRFTLPEKHKFLFTLKQKVSLRSFFYRKSAVVLSGIILFRNMVYMKGNPYQLLCLYIGLFGVVVIVFMMSHIYFPIKLRLFTPIFWYTTLMYVFPFLATTEFILHGISPLIIRMLFVVTFGFLLSFVRWKLAFLLSWMGSCLAVIVSNFVVSYNPSDFVVHIPTLLNVSLWHSGIALLLGAFVVDYDEKEEGQNKYLVNHLFGQRYSTVEVIWKLVYPPKTIKEAFKEEKIVRHSIMHEAEENLDKNNRGQFNLSIRKLKKRFENPLEDKYIYTFFPSFHDREFLIKEYRDAAILAGCSHVSLEIDKKVELVNCDKMVIEKAIWKFVIDYCKIAEENFAEDTDAVLSIYSTNIAYQMELPKRPYYPVEYEDMGTLPAVGISISEREILRSSCSPIKECYTKKIRAEFRRILLDSQDVEMRDAMLGVDAHYGLVEIDEQNLCWQCIIPVDYSIIDERVLISRTERRKRSYEDY